MNDFNLNKEFLIMLSEQGKKNTEEISKVHRDVVQLGQQMVNTTSKLDDVSASFKDTANKLNEFITQQAKLSEKFLVVPSLINDVETLKNIVLKKNAFHLNLNKNLTYIATGGLVLIAIVYEVWAKILG